MKNSTTNILLGLALVAVVAVSLVVGGLHTGAAEPFVGTDAAATEQIQAANPGYQPWFTSVFAPGSGEVESGLFALQAAIGGSVLGFAVGALWGRRRGRTAEADAPPAAGPTA